MPSTPTGPPQDLDGVPPTTTGKHSSVRIRGTVSDGIEPGCMLLTSNDVVYQLIWPHGTPVTGRTIEVEATIEPGLLTTCQQGIPLVVQKVLSP
jgi:hypothetical protein